MQTDSPLTGVNLTGESLSAFKRAIKIGYYKAMLREGIINNTEFAKLMEIINR